MPSVVNNEHTFHWTHLSSLSHFPSGWHCMWVAKFTRWGGLHLTVTWAPLNNGRLQATIPWTLSLHVKSPFEAGGGRQTPGNAFRERSVEKSLVWSTKTIRDLFYTYVDTSVSRADPILPWRNCSKMWTYFFRPRISNLSHIEPLCDEEVRTSVTRR